jgi:Ca-activated chloride channel family protein
MTNPESLLGMVHKYANRKSNKVYTTFVGVGLDFNSELIQEISTVRGANYMSVQSNAEFIEKMDDEFDFMVSPMVFNVELKLESEGGQACIQAVYGSNDIDLNSGQIMKINSLFPAPLNDEGETKGGIVLSKLKPKDAETASIKLFINCSYEDVDEQAFVNRQEVILRVQNSKSKKTAATSNDYYDNSGVRKGILLVRYVLLIKKWIKSTKVGGARFAQLKVSKKYKNIFGVFKKHMVREMNILGDKSLQQEIDILDRLIQK